MSIKFSLICLLVLFNTNLFSQGGGQNYVVTYIPRVAINNDLSITPSSSAENITKHITYFDGLGRAIQQVDKQLSPSLQDIVTPIVYDNMGRQIKNYLPFTSSEANGYFKSNSVSVQKNFYATTHLGIIKDDEPYGITNYEYSILSRVLSTYGAGKTWHDNGKKISYTYRINADYEVRKWIFDRGTQTCSSKNTDKFYEKESLFVTETIDEQSNKTIDYKDHEGNLVLKKVEDKTGHFLFTYYVYDDHSNLRLVITPLASEKLEVQNLSKDFSLTSTNTYVKNLCFSYNYDSRQRLILKKVPGAEAVTMMYDQRDRLRLSQDGNQKNKSIPEWTYTKYDALNRVVMTGILKSSKSQAELKSLIDNSSFYETRANNALGYSQDNSYPKSTDNIETLVITYYDNYDFVNYSGWTNNNLYNFNNDGLAINQQSAVVGQVTGNKVKVLEQETWLRSVSYYDYKYQPIQVIQDNYLGGYDRITTQFYFTGLEDQVKRTHSDGSKTTTIVETYQYDHSNRLLSISHRINNQDPVVIAQNQYNEIGQLITKDLHVNTGSIPLQSMDYRYNIRGWLRSINDPSLGSDPITNPYLESKPSDLFGMELLYEQNTSNLPTR